MKVTFFEQIKRLCNTIVDNTNKKLSDIATLIAGVLEEIEQMLNNLSNLLGDTKDTEGTTQSGTAMAKLNTILQSETDIKNLIGQSANTRGSIFDGSVMVKLNQLLADWTTARAEKIDTIKNGIGKTGDTGGTTAAGTVTAKINASLQNEVDIKTLIGQTGNSGGTSSAGTAMAKLNKLLTDWTTTRAGRIDTINSAIGTAAGIGGTATTGTVMAKLNALLSQGCIKSIQRGTFVEDYNVETPKANKINISTVDPKKTFVIINGGLSAGYSNSSSAVRGYVGAITATSFTYYAGRASITIGAGTVSYQVIEFY